MSAWCCPARCDRSTEGVIRSDRNGRICSHPAMPDWLIWPLLEQLIQPLQMFDVSGQMIQKHHIEQNSRPLVTAKGRSGRQLLPDVRDFRSGRRWPRSCPLPVVSTGLRGCCSLTQPSPKNARALSAVLQLYRLKHQRNRGRRANMFDGDLRRQGHSPASDSKSGVPSLPCKKR